VAAGGCDHRAKTIAANGRSAAAISQRASFGDGDQSDDVIKMR
jgi:hypothetical protein